MEREQFADRLVSLRMKKGVSARDMSLSLGQSPSYINNIENGINLPSMTAFFYICDYLGVTPQEFFNMESHSVPDRVLHLSEEMAGLSDDALAAIESLVHALKR